ncbi:unnamed protein product [Aphanomyces euteiches]
MDASTQQEFTPSPQPNKYNNEDERTPIAVLDDKPQPATFLEEFQDMLADPVCTVMSSFDANLPYSSK